ncbi:spinocerebellar ataxia type 10 protein domain-containing protein [Blastocladiella britannica]|nr:spinocerebellar ataxia type 10 protein domain-containing protein [Blastocladiella britannica]
MRGKRYNTKNICVGFPCARPTWSALFPMEKIMTQQLEQFIDDLKDLVTACNAPPPIDTQEIREILIDIASDLGKSQECREYTGRLSPVLWVALLIIVDQGTPLLDRELTLVVLRAIRNACINVHEAQESIATTADIGKFMLACLASTSDRAITMAAVEAVSNLASGYPTLAKDAPSTFGASRKLANLVLDVLVMQPATADRRRTILMAMVLLANRLLPFRPVSAGQRASEGAVVLERILMLACAERGATMGSHEVAEQQPDDDPADLTAVLLGELPELATGEIATATAAVAVALARHNVLPAAWHALAPLPRVELLMHLTGSLSPTRSEWPAGIADCAIPFLVEQWTLDVAQVVAASSIGAKTDANAGEQEKDEEMRASLSMPPASLLLEELHFFDAITVAGSQPASLVEPLVAMLAWLHASQPRTTAKSAVAPSTDATSGDSIFGTKKLVLLVLAQLITENRALQDAAREAGAVPLVLAQCAYDDMHPFIREYGIFCLHSMVKHNPESQALIDGMRAVDIADETKAMLKEELKLDPEAVRKRILGLDAKKSAPK